MNLILIGNDIDAVALDIWKANTNYTVLNQSPYIWNKQFTNFIENRPVIVVTTAEQFQSKQINETLDFMINLKFIPIFIADNKASIENKMYTALIDEIPSAVLWIKNKENKNYNELIKISQGYLLEKGMIKNDNKTLRTPRKRKKSTTQE